VKKIWLIIALLELGNTIAYGDDFIIKVPLDVRNLSPQVIGVKVVCRLRYSQPFNGSQTLGEGEEYIPVSKDENGIGRVFRPISNPATVKVSIGASATSSPNEYHCFLELRGPKSNGSPMNAAPYLQNQSASTSVKPKWAQADPNKPFKPYTLGHITQ